MLRVIVGTVAVLAGFGVLEHSVDASTGLSGSCTATQAYALLQPGETVAVRATASPESAATDTLGASLVTLVGSQGGWAKIALGDSSQHQTGWIPADLLTVDTRLDGPVTIYDRPGLLGHEIGRIEGQDTRFRVLGCRGEWLQVINARHGNVWIDRWCAKEEGCRRG